MMSEPMGWVHEHFSIRQQAPNLPHGHLEMVCMWPAIHYMFNILHINAANVILPANSHIIAKFVFLHGQTVRSSFT
jgi:hypothetical protein